jgi:cytoskeletal protein CcmA (bactofilin family)
VLKKFIPQRPDQTPHVEDTTAEGTPPALSSPEQKSAIQTNPVMADTPNKNSLSKDVQIKGSIKFVNEFVFDGNLEGEITSADGILTVGENADVRGEVKSKTVIVKGKVHGNITVQERCELHARSQLIGDLKAARLVIEEGATFVGKSEVTPNKSLLSNLGNAPKEEPLKPVGAPR